MAHRPKRLEFDVDLDEATRFVSGGEPLALPDGWSAESLVLAGLLRCSLTSLRYHARRGAADVAVRGARARGVVTRRDEDERYAFVEIAAELEVEIDPAPDGDAAAALLARAERDCFVGASLTAAPCYAWTVNGRRVEPARG